MANVAITFRIMPAEADMNLTEIEEEVKSKISDYAETSHIRTEIEPIAFGLKALKIIFTMNENKSLETLENSIKENSNIASVEAIDVRRTVG